MEPETEASAVPSTSAPRSPLGLAVRSGPTCTSLKKDGAPCNGGATAASGYQFCPYHDPEVTEDQKLVWARRGGYAATRSSSFQDAPDPELQSPEQIRAFIQETAGRVLRGEVSPAVGVTLTGLARAALTAFEHNLMARLAQLEEVAAAQAKPVGWRKVVTR